MNKQNFGFFFLLFVLTLLQFACSSTRQAVPSQIGLLPLDGYEFTAGNPVTDTAYRVIRSEADFDASFRAAASARRPAFHGQTVVAIVLKTAPSTPLHFSRAEKEGRMINVYAQTCTECSSSRAVMATIPTVGDARSVRFFINGENKAVLGLQD